MANNSVLQSFAEYDTAASLPNNLTNNDLRGIAKSIRANQMETDHKKLNEKIPEKITKFMSILHAAETAVNNKISMLNKLNIRVSNFRLSTTLSAESVQRAGNGVVTRMKFYKKENGSTTPSELNLNVNVKKLLNYSAMEVYTILTTSLYKAALGKNIDKITDVQNKTMGQLKMETLDKKNVDIKNTFQYKLAQYKVTSYVKKTIKESLDRTPITASANYIVDQLFSNSLNDEAIFAIAENKFNLDKLYWDVLSIDGYSKFDPSRDIKSVEELNAKVNKEPQTHLIKKEKEELFNRYTNSELKISAGDRREEVTESLKNDDKLKNSFNDIKAVFTDSGIVNSEQNINKLKSFCKNFSASFMAAHGLEPVEIKFVTYGSALGEYHDLGTSQYIEVNLAKATDIVDFTATLAHELTHAAESSTNKAQGMFNKYGGGILDSISTSTKNSGLSGTALDVLKEINHYCYKVDPCERRAREGEAVGIKFIEELTGQEFSDDINRYNKTNNAYMDKVDEKVANLPQAIAEFENKLNSLNLSETSKGYEMIEERIQYLKNCLQKERDKKKDEKTNKRKKDEKLLREDNKKVEEHKEETVAALKDF